MIVTLCNQVKYIHNWLLSICNFLECSAKHFLNWSKFYSRAASNILLRKYLQYLINYSTNWTKVDFLGHKILTLKVHLNFSTKYYKIHHSRFGHISLALVPTQHWWARTTVHQSSTTIVKHFSYLGLRQLGQCCYLSKDIKYISTYYIEIIHTHINIYITLLSGYSLLKS